MRHVESVKVAGVPDRNLAINAQACVGPRPNPVTVMEIGCSSGSVPRMCLVITTSGTQRARPTAVAVSFMGNMVRIQKSGL